METWTLALTAASYALARGSGGSGAGGASGSGGASSGGASGSGGADSGGLVAQGKTFQKPASWTGCTETWCN